MKAYVQFLTLDTKNGVCDLLGSDGVFILDGRNKVRTWIEDAHIQRDRLKNVQPDIVGYKIILASDFRSKGTCVHEKWNQGKIEYIRRNKNNPRKSIK